MLVCHAGLLVVNIQGLLPVHLNQRGVNHLSYLFGYGFWEFNSSQILGKKKKKGIKMNALYFALYIYILHYQRNWKLSQILLYKSIILLIQNLVSRAFMASSSNPVPLSGGFCQ